MADPNHTLEGREEPILLGDGTANDHTEVRLLVEAYARLREEVEQLRDEQKKLKEEKGQEKGKDKKKGDDGDQDEDEGDDKEGGEKGKEKPKEPFFTRASNWSKAHPLAVVAMIAGFVILLVAGFFLWRYLESFESTDDAEVDGHIDQISSRINGTVVGVYVENSQNVKKGEVLVDLDPRDYQVALAQSKANLSQAQANVEVQNPNVPITTTSQATQVSTTDQSVVSAEAGVVSAQRTYEAAEADLRQAEADAANAATEERRYRELVDKEEVSREVYDQRATAARAQQAAVSSRRAAADASLKVVDQRKAELNQAHERAEEARANQPRQVAIQRANVANRQAGAQAARAQMDQALLNLSYAKVLAPVDGIIGDKTVEVGTQVSIGQELFAITQIDDIWVTANFKETQVRRMKPQQAVTIYVDTLTQDFDGYIENMPGATGAKYSLLPPENATGNYVKVVQRLPVRIRFKHGQKGEERLRPGMSVEPKVWVQ
ncbi:MAG: HlyD family secretion protein [Bryobacteraceae bacterium]